MFSTQCLSLCYLLTLRSICVNSGIVSGGVLSIFLCFLSNKTSSSLEALLIRMLVTMLLGFHGVSDWEALTKILYPNKVNLWNLTKLSFSLLSPCFLIWRCKHLNLHTFINNLFVESSSDARRCYGSCQTRGLFYDFFFGSLKPL